MNVMKLTKCNSVRLYIHGIALLGALFFKHRILSSPNVFSLVALINISCCFPTYHKSVPLAFLAYNICLHWPRCEEEEEADWIS